MGIDPIDFSIYKELGIFDHDGTHKNIFKKEEKITKKRIKIKITKTIKTMKTASTYFRGLFFPRG